MFFLKQFYKYLLFLVSSRARSHSWTFVCSKPSSQRWAATKLMKRETFLTVLFSHPSCICIKHSFIHRFSQRSRLSRGIKVTQGHIMLLSVPIRFQFYGFLCVLGFSIYVCWTIRVPGASKRLWPLTSQLLDQWIMNLLSESDLFSSFKGHFIWQHR